MVDALVFFWLLLKAALVSTSGVGNLPILHNDLLARGWASERTFAEALSVGQVSPGPTGLWVISLGYLVDGPRGALLACVASALPPLLVLAVDRLHRRVGNHPAIRGLVAGIGLAVVGSFGVVMAQLLRENGIDALAVIVALGAAVLGLTRRVPVLAIIVAAAVVGVIFYR
ncbi:MAG: chromate transporter [Chloroflexales bacterium]|nr:chromate transporter [Chloroflexales bacterium]